MARTVDPQRHEARRLQIIDAALTVFAAKGYDGATTAAICREAGIGSGTFFHYFPTKLELLLAILRLGTAEEEQLAADLVGIDDPVAAILQVVDGTIEDAADPRAGGFILAVAGVMNEPEVAAALEADEATQRDVLREAVRRAHEAGLVRTDLTPERTTSWLRLLLDGFLQRVATDPHFAAEREGEILRDSVATFLRG